MSISNGVLANATNFNTAFASKTSANTLTGVQTLDEEIIMKQNATPSNPASTYNKLYFKSDNKLYSLSSAGTESQVTPTSGITWTVTSIKTGTYTAAAGEIVRVNGASAFTVNFPAAASNTGQSIKVFRTDQTLANAVTVDFNSSETGNGSTTVTLNTQYEIYEFTSDGTNWMITTHNIPSVWTSYSPTFTGWGTPTGVSIWWKRSGTDILIKGSYDPSAADATEARLSLPSGLTSDSVSIPALQLAGWYHRDTSTADKGGRMLIESGVTYFTFGQTETVGSSSVNPLTKTTASSIGSQAQTFEARCAVSGWME